MKYQNYKTQLCRVYLLADLPGDLTRASQHLQLFDNYINHTRLRLRYVRSPQTKEWTRIMQQRFPVNENDLRIWQASEIYLNEAEFQTFERFEGREIRKNRYFYTENSKDFEVDVYLGDLWGLCLAKVFFENKEELEKFEKPEFAVTEVTGKKFFTGENLVGKTFADVQKEFAQKVSGS